MPRGRLGLPGHSLQVAERGLELPDSGVPAGRPCTQRQFTRPFYDCVKFFRADFKRAAKHLEDAPQDD